MISKIKTAFLRHKARNSTPVIDTSYNYVYTLDLPFPEPCRNDPDVIYLPSKMVLLFTDRERMSLLRVSESKQLQELAASILVEGIHTPLDFYMDSNGKARIQEGHHRMCVVSDNIDVIKKVPVRFKQSNGKIKSFGRPVVEEFATIIDIIGKIN